MSNRLQTFRVIITGVTGMVGEGVLLECLESPSVEHVLILGRRPYGVTHAKLEECIVADFSDLSSVEDRLRGYDACFNCAGVSSAGMNEADYTRVAYDMVLAFAGTLARLNPKMIFTHVTGASTDSTEKGRVMWARVKGRAENALMRLAVRRGLQLSPRLDEADGRTAKHQDALSCSPRAASDHPVVHADAHPPSSRPSDDPRGDEGMRQARTRGPRHRRARSIIENAARARERERGP